MYKERFYRDWMAAPDLVKFEVKVKETDLLIYAEKNLQSQAENFVRDARKEIEDYISIFPEFETSLRPIEPIGKAPLIVKEICKTAKICNVGPMAAIAGAIAEYVGKKLLTLSKDTCLPARLSARLAEGLPRWTKPRARQVIVENGGDIFIKSDKKRKIGIFAGESALSNKVAIEISPGMTPIGVCTSSGTVGPSLSFGRADAVTILSKSTILADAAATAIGNLVKTEEDIQNAISQAKKIKGLLGVLIIKGPKIGIWGEVSLASCLPAGRRSGQNFA